MATRATSHTAVNAERTHQEALSRLGTASAGRGKKTAGWNWPTAGAERAYEHCLTLARNHYENFPTASRVLLKKELAGPVAAVYAFSRTADDYADEPGMGTPEERLAKLDAWEKHLDRALAGEPMLPEFVAVAETIHRYNLPVQLFRDLLSAFRQDVTRSRYASAAEMLDYCTRSANPVGRLVLRLHGYDDPRLDEMSDAICTALQLANFWQDVAIDLEKDRIYLPQDEMKKFGVTEAQLRAGQVDENYRKLLASEAARVQALFEKGRPLCDAVDGRLRIWLRCVWLGGTTILRNTEKAGFDVFRRRPAITGFDKLRILVQALIAWPAAPRALPAPAAPSAGEAH